MDGGDSSEMGSVTKMKESKSQRPASVPTSPQTSEIKKRATTLCIIKNLKSPLTDGLCTPIFVFLMETEKALYQQHSFNEHLTPRLLAFPLYSDVHIHCPESPDRHRSMKRVMAIKMKTIEVIRFVSSIDLTKMLSVCVLVQWIHVCQHVALTV